MTNPIGNDLKKKRNSKKRSKKTRKLYFSSKCCLTLMVVVFVIILLQPSIFAISQVVTTSSTQITPTPQTFKQGDIIDIKVHCLTNGTYCGPAANCSMTLLYPNNTLIIDNGLMTSQTSFNNYTLSDSIILGDYSCLVSCCEEQSCGSNDCNFTITTTGNKNWNIIPLFLLLGAFIIFGFSSYLKNEYIGLFSGMVFIVAGVYMMLYGLGIFQDMYTRTIAYISLGIGLTVCFIAIVEMFYTDLGIIGEKE